MNRALARTLEMAQRLAAAEHDVELLRRESLNSLSKAAARRVLEQSYTAVLTMAPLPGPPLPLSGTTGVRTACAPSNPASASFMKQNMREVHTDARGLVRRAHALRAIHSGSESVAEPGRVHRRGRGTDQPGARQGSAAVAAAALSAGLPRRHSVAVVGRRQGQSGHSRSRPPSMDTERPSVQLSLDRAASTPALEGAPADPIFPGISCKL